MARYLIGTSTDTFGMLETPSLDITGYHLTMFCWFFPGTLASDTGLITKAIYSGSGVQYLLGHNTTQALIQIGDGGGFDQLIWGTMRTGAWHAICAVKTPTQLLGMMRGNGAPVFSHTASTRSIQNTAYNVSLGVRHDGGGDEANGLLAHAAIWNASLIPDEMLRLCNGTSPLLIRPGSLQAYWPLNEYGHAQDVTRNANREFMNGTVTLKPFKAELVAPPLLVLPIASEISLEVGPQDVSVPFLAATTVFYDPMLIHGLAITPPFIASATSLFGGSISNVLAYAPTIASATVVYEPSVRRSSVAVGLLASETQVFTPRLVRLLANVVPPTISGVAMEGQQLESSDGVWSGTPPFVYAYQWRRCNAAGGACVDIGGATARTYIVQPADVGGTLRIRVTATDSA